MKLLVIGAGGYFKSFLDTLHPSQFDIVGLIDDRYPEIQEWFGYPVLGTVDDIEKIIDQYEVHNLFVTIGNSAVRKTIYKKVAHLKVGFPTIIDATAIVSRQAKIGHGTFIGKGSIINNDVQLGEFVVVNSGAIVEHGSRIGNNVNISPGAVLNGQVTVGDSSYIGSNSVIIQTRTIGSNVIIGAGAVIIRDVPDDVTVVGNPGRILDKGDK